MKTSQTIAAERKIIRQRYAQARERLRVSEQKEMAQLQAQCARIGHEWEWHQVAGEGRYCLRCDLWDYSVS